MTRLPTGPNARVDEVASAIERFLWQKQAEGCLDTTLSSYRWALAKFARDTGLVELRQVTEDAVIAWSVSLRTQGLKSGAINSTQRPVWTWLRWLFQRDLVSIDISRRVRKVPPRDVSRRTATVEVKEAMLAQVRRGRECPFRNAAIIEVLSGTGMRRGELVALDLASVDMPKGTITVLGKGQKRRAIGMDDRTRDALRAYIAHERGHAPGPLFTSRDRQTRMTVGAVHLMFRGAQSALGVKCSPHDFRRAAAVALLGSGMREISAMHQLGHEGPEMLRMYARHGEEVRAIDEYHSITGTQSEQVPEDDKPRFTLPARRLRVATMDIAPLSSLIDDLQHLTEAIERVGAALSAAERDRILAETKRLRVARTSLMLWVDENR